MKIKDGYKIVEIAGGYFAVPVGEECRTSNKTIVLNDSAVDMWNVLLKGATEEELISYMLKEYEVNEDTIKKDVSDFIKTLSDAQLLED